MLVRFLSFQRALMRSSLDEQHTLGAIGLLCLHRQYGLADVLLSEIALHSIVSTQRCDLLPSKSSG